MMDWKKGFRLFCVIIGFVCVVYGEISDTSAVITMGIGFYLLVNAEKKARKN